MGVMGDGSDGCEEGDGDYTDIDLSISATVSLIKQP